MHNFFDVCTNSANQFDAWILAGEILYMLIILMTRVSKWLDWLHGASLTSVELLSIYFETFSNLKSIDLVLF